MSQFDQSTVRAGRGTMSPRAYVFTVFITSLVGLGAVAGLIFGSQKAGREASQDRVLLDYQLGKLSKPTASTIFVGDSSLGNAIDGDVWSKLSGESATNLALTGSYGYAGSYNMLRRSLRNGTPRNVIIMQAADMMGRKISEIGYDLTATGDGDEWFASYAASWRLSMNTDELELALRWLSEVLLHPTRLTAPPPASVELAHDYMRQGQPVHIPSDVRQLLYYPNLIQLEKKKYLRLLVQICRANNLNCIFVHGPLAAPLCDMSDPYFQKVAQVMHEERVRLVSVHPLCIPQSKLGDSRDHVKTEYKAEFTQKYFNELRPYLR